MGLPCGFAGARAISILLCLQDRIGHLIVCGLAGESERPFGFYRDALSKPMR